MPKRQLTAERLREAITIAVTDKDIRERATKIDEQIRAEDGVAQAIEIIESLAQ